jgi:hypothetical protein
MAHADKGFRDLVAHLKTISSLDNIQEEAQLRGAATASAHADLPNIPTTKEDITKLAGVKPALMENKKIIIDDWNKKQSIKENKEEEGRPSPAKPTGKSSITDVIEQTDYSLEAKLTRVGITEAKRLEKIADLEKQIAELKSQEIEENTYDIEKFKNKVKESLENFLKEATADQLVELYGMISDEDVSITEDGNIMVNTLQENGDEEVNEDDLELDEYSDDKEETGFTDKQIKMAFGVLNDPKFKGGNYDGAVEVINKIAPGLADHPSVANALKRANEDTNEASGYEGQSEFRKHEIKLAGDFDQENPVSDADAEAVKKAIMKNSGEQEGRSIVVDVEPSEGAYDSVVVHTMRDREDILKYLGDMVDEGTKDFSNDVEQVTEAKKKPKPTKPSLWTRAKAEAKKKFDVYPSAYANAWAAKWYKSKGGGWRS